MAEDLEILVVTLEGMYDAHFCRSLKVQDGVLHSLELDLLWKN